MEKELETPDEQRRLARGFKWYAEALETTVQDGIFFLRQPDTVFLLDLDILRAYLRPVGIRADVAGLVSAFLQHPRVNYAIPPGCFEELVEWLTPLRQQLQEWRGAWTAQARSKAESRIGQFLKLDVGDIIDQVGLAGDESPIDMLLSITERLERILSTDRFLGFSDEYDQVLARALESQLGETRDRLEPAGSLHSKRDSRDASNIAAARMCRLNGAARPLVLLTRTKEVFNLLDSQEITSSYLFNSFFTTRSDEPSDLENYPVMSIQRLAGLWSVGFFDNPEGSTTEAQLLADACRGANQKLMGQAVFRELSHGKAKAKAEEDHAKSTRPAIMSTLDGVAKHVLSVQFELARVAEVDRTKLEASMTDDSSSKAGRILTVMSSVAKRLFGPGTLRLELRGIPADSAIVSVSRILGPHLRSLPLFHMTKFPQIAEFPEQNITRWPTVCNPYRLLEALSQVIILRPEDLKEFDAAIVDEDMLGRTTDGVMIHTNLGPFLVSYYLFLEKSTGKLRYPGHARILRLLDAALRKLTRTSSSIIEDIQQLVFSTPFGDIYLDLERIGANEDRYVAVATDGPKSLKHVAYLIEQTGVWWTEIDEATQSLADAETKANEFLMVGAA